MDGRGGVGGDLLEQLGRDVRGVVAGDRVLQPHHIEWLHRLGQLEDVVGHHAGAAVEREAHLVAEDILHRLDTGDRVLEAPLSVMSPRFG